MIDILRVVRPGVLGMVLHVSKSKAREVKMKILIEDYILATAKQSTTDDYQIGYVPTSYSPTTKKHVLGQA